MIRKAANTCWRCQGRGYVRGSQCDACGGSGFFRRPSRAAIKAQAELFAPKESPPVLKGPRKEFDPFTDPYPKLKED
jgi:hypothetical protein